MEFSGISAADVGRAFPIFLRAMVQLFLVLHYLRIVHFLGWKIETYIRANNGECKVYPAPFAVHLDADNKTYVEPDISVICDKSKLDERGCNGAPDWIIEIVSTSSRRMDYAIKSFIYRNAGVREYWIVDSDKDRITVWNYEQDTMDEYSF